MMPLPVTVTDLANVEREARFLAAWMVDARTAEDATERDYAISRARDELEGIAARMGFAVQPLPTPTDLAA